MSPYQDRTLYFTGDPVGGGSSSSTGSSVFWSCTSSFASSDMLIDAYFLASLFSQLSGELLPLCDLPWEFNSNCDHTSTDEMRAGTQQSARRDAGRFIEDFFSGLKRAAVSGSRDPLFFFSANQNIFIP